MEALFEAIQSNDVTKIKDILLSNSEDQKKCLNQLIKSVDDVKMLDTLFNTCGEEANDFFKNHQQYILKCAIKLAKNLLIIKSIIQLDKGCINRSDASGRTPLVVAVSTNKKVRLINFLLENNAKINVCEGSGKTPLHFAKNLEVVKLLITNGAIINCSDNQGLTPIMTAMCNQVDREIILEFIKNGADLNARNQDGQTCLHLALHSKYDEDIIHLMYGNTLDYNLEDNFGETPLCYALKDCVTEDSRTPYGIDFIHLLIDKGFVVNTNVFMYAVEGSNEELIASLLKYVDIRCVDKDGNCVLHHANEDRIINMLVRRGAPINHKNNAGNTPIMEAIISQKKDAVIESLLFWGSDIKELHYFFDIDKHMTLSVPNSVYDLLILYGMSVSLRNTFVKGFMNRTFVGKTKLRRLKLIFEHGLLVHMVLSKENISVTERLMLIAKVNIIIEPYHNELLKMKCEYLTEDVSYFDFLIEGYRTIKSPFGDSGLTEADYENIKMLFPSFYKQLIVKIKINIKINKRKALLRKLDYLRLANRGESKSNKNENSSFEYFNLDYYSMNVVASYLKDREISCLLAAAVID